MDAMLPLALLPVLDRLKSFVAGSRTWVSYFNRDYFML
jgi:hypothetical protein